MKDVYVLSRTINCNCSAKQLIKRQGRPLQKNFLSSHYQTSDSEKEPKTCTLKSRKVPRTAYG